MQVYSIAFLCEARGHTIQRGMDRRPVHSSVIIQIIEKKSRRLQLLRCPRVLLSFDVDAAQGL